MSLRERKKLKEIQWQNARKKESKRKAFMLGKSFQVVTSSEKNTEMYTENNIFEIYQPKCWVNCIPFCIRYHLIEGLNRVKL